MKEGWEYKKLEEVGRVITGSTPSTKSPENYSSKDVCFVKPSDLPKDGVGLVIDTEFHISKKAYNNSRKLPKGSVLTTCIGIVGKVAILQVDATCNQQINAIIPDATISSHFLAYSILSKRDYLEKRANAPVVPIINKKDFSSTVIAVPPLSEQQHIVEELDLLSSIIEKKKAQLKELDNLAQSLFYEMFGDPIINEKGWEVKKLKEACTCITDGDHMPPPKVDKGIPFITISNIDKQNREIDFRDTFFVPQSYYDSINKERKAQIDDVLYTVTGSYGIPIIVKEDRNFCFQRHIALLRPNKHLVSPCYLCYWALCKSIKYLADDVATGIAQKTVGLSSLREFPIIIPPLALQQQFASKIEAIEHQKELTKQSIKEVETLFNSRMDYYFN